MGRWIMESEGRAAKETHRRRDGSRGLPSQMQRWHPKRCIHTRDWHKLHDIDEGRTPFVGEQGHTFPCITSPACSGHLQPGYGRIVWPAMPTKIACRHPGHPYSHSP